MSRTIKISGLALLVIALACALLAGHPQTAMYVVYATLAYGLFLAWPTRTAQSSISNTQFPTPKVRLALARRERQRSCPLSNLLRRCLGDN